MIGTTAPPVVVWFRDDLRTADNPALIAAVESGAPVICLYVLDEVSPGIRPLGAAAKWWLHHSLAALRSDLEALGGTLVLRSGAAEVELAAVLHETGATRIVWNRRYGAAERAVDEAVAELSARAGATTTAYGATLLFEPWTISTAAGTPFAVYSPFWRACLAAPEPRRPLEAPERIVGGDVGTLTELTDPADLADLQLLPTRPDWAGGLREAWTPGQAHGMRALNEFLSGPVAAYRGDREHPSINATSRLSPHLRWGEISPHQVWHAAKAMRSAQSAEGVATFVSELGWREFAYHVLYQRPALATQNIRPEFDAFPWPDTDPDALKGWQRGETGVPLVDAGMRELWATGTMHNRVRMVTASFLTKNLLIDWREGERWFWDTLVDADPASNPFNWQWVAGSGADAAPYFRVFNPELQREKFDQDGRYVRRWVPEWGGGAYPHPIVDLAESRRAALAAYDAVKRRAAAQREYAQ